MIRILLAALVSALLCSIVVSPARAGSNSYKHAQDVLRFFHNHPRLANTPAGRRVIRIHRALLRRLTPPIAHESMWLCIHAKEGSWNSNTGNGYYGGLQAHYNWYGVARMDLLSPYAQMAHAEAIFRSTGYSLAWIRQQWPNTSWGCV